MSDPTEQVRRELVQEINSDAAKERAEAVAKHGVVWDTTELQRDFEVIGFLAPFVVVRRRSDGKKGSLMFQNSPRYYFSWSPDER